MFEVCILQDTRSRRSDPAMFDTKQEMNRGLNEIRFILLTNLIHEDTLYLSFRTDSMEEAQRESERAKAFYSQRYQYYAAQQKG